MNLLTSPFAVYAQTIQPWGSCVVDGVPTLKCLEVVYGNIVTMSSAFIVLILFIMFIVGGFNYLTSFGNAEKVKKAQGTLRLALMGFIIFVSAYLIIKIIGVLFLGGNSNSLFNFNLEVSPAP